MLKWNDVLKLSLQGSPPPAQQNIQKTAAEWHELLSDEQYYITRDNGTERPFNSPLCNTFQPGLYSCTCCAATGTETLLFDATKKFNSGTGWPSFTQPITDNAIAYINDSSHGMARIEATCNTCQAHLGHVFPDGPQPGELRYCINAISLKKSTQGE